MEISDFLQNISNQSTITISMIGLLEANQYDSSTLLQIQKEVWKSNERLIYVDDNSMQEMVAFLEALSKQEDFSYENLLFGLNSISILTHNAEIDIYAPYYE